MGRALPWAYSIALHVVLLGLLSMSFALTRLPTPPASGVAIQATVVDEARIAQELESLKAIDRKHAEDQKREARRAEDARTARQLEEQRLVALEQQRKTAEQDAARKAEEAQKLDDQRKADEVAAQARQQELKAQQEAEQERLAKVEAQRKAEEVRLAAVAKERAEAEAKAKREADAAKQRELDAQLRDALAEEDDRRNAVKSGLLDQYLTIIAQKVTRNWVRPPTAVSGLSCDVHVTQIPGGEVVDVHVGTCNGDAVVARSIEAAVRKASPLPPPPDPSLFDRDLVFHFEPE